MKKRILLFLLIACFILSLSTVACKKETPTENNGEQKQFVEPNPSDFVPPSDLITVPDENIDDKLITEDDIIINDNGDN